VEVHVDVRGKSPERRARRHAEGMCGRQLQQSAPSAEPEPYGPARLEPRVVLRQVRGPEGRRRAVHVAELSKHTGYAFVQIPAAAAEEPRLETVLAHPRRLSANAVGVLGSRRDGPRVGRPDEVRVVAERPQRRRRPRPLQPEIGVLAGLLVGRAQQRGDPKSARPPSLERREQRPAAVVERALDVAGDYGDRSHSPPDRRCPPSEESATRKRAALSSAGTAYRLPSVCGICGFLAPSGQPDPTFVEQMNAALVHRGPDEGSVDAFGRCVLGNRRLQIIDLVTGSQPVENEAGDIVCVFNGEVYNFGELREELTRRGHEIRGTGDTPVIPHLYEEHGRRFVEHLSGMFAVAVWDRGRERLVLARDRVGKKPLLWTRLADGSLAFASELKALLRLPGLHVEVDPDAIDAYLALQYVPGGTGLVGIEKLPPGHVLVAEGESVRVERYARLEPSNSLLHGAGEAGWLALVRERVETAVRRRLISDVPLGALLSGGLDSSIVVSLMARASFRPVRTFTVCFGDERYDERRYARAVAERYGTEHEEIVLEEDVAGTLPRLAEAFDEPLGDDAALPLYLVCEAARRHVTVALTGDGGDESFAGYERYVAHELAGRLHFPGARAVARVLRSVGKERRSTAVRAARLLDAAAAQPGERYGRLMEVFPAELRTRLFEPSFVPRPVPAWQLLGPPPRPGIAGLQELDVQTYLPGDLLLKADLASMAHSLELRSPLLDWDVLELGISLPPGLKTKGRRGKEALRRAFAADLPDEVANRGKTGFGVPIGDWFRNELRDLAGDVLLDSRARGRGQLRPQAVERLLSGHVSRRADHAHRLWCLLMLELWQRTHLDR
jgi:asparagine synthase (glutamine-hydrolysing)